MSDNNKNSLKLNLNAQAYVPKFMQKNQNQQNMPNQYMGDNNQYQSYMNYPNQFANMQMPYGYPPNQYMNPSQFPPSNQMGPYPPVSGPHFQPPPQQEDDGGIVGLKKKKNKKKKNVEDPNKNQAQNNNQINQINQMQNQFNQINFGNNMNMNNNQQQPYHQNQKKQQKQKENNTPKKSKNNQKEKNNNLDGNKKDNEAHLQHKRKRDDNLNNNQNLPVKDILNNIISDSVNKSEVGKKIVKKKIDAYMLFKEEYYQMHKANNEEDLEKNCKNAWNELSKDFKKYYNMNAENENKKSITIYIIFILKNKNMEEEKNEIIIEGLEKKKMK